MFLKGSYASVVVKLDMVSMRASSQLIVPLQYLKGIKDRRIRSKKGVTERIECKKVEYTTWNRDDAQKVDDTATPWV